MTRVKRDKIFVDLNDPTIKVKKFKKKKDLEKLRKNVLAAKQKMNRSKKNTQEKVTKNSLEKTLNNFAQIRQKNEDETQGINRSKKVKNKTICSRLLPEPSIGIFKNGARGKEVRRTSNFPFHQQNEARLRSDVFKLLNGEDMTFPKEAVENEVSENDCSEDKSDPLTVKNNNNDNNDNSIKGSGNYASINDRSRNINARKNNQQQHKNFSKMENLQRPEKTKRRLFENDSIGNEVDDNLDNIPIDPLHFSPRAREQETVASKSSKTDNSDTDESDQSWDPLAKELFEDLCDKIDESFDVDYSKLNIPDPVTEIKSRLANIYMRTHSKRGTASNNNDTYPFPRAGTSRTSEKSTQVQPCTVTSDNNDSTPLNPFTKSTPHDYETIELRIKNALAALPDKLVFPIPDPFFCVDTTEPEEAEPEPSASLTTGVNKTTETDNKNIDIDADTVIITDTDSNRNGVKKKLSDDKLINRTVNTPVGSTVSSPPVGWDANVENERNLIRRNLKHMPAILRRTQPREFLFDLEHLSEVKPSTAQVPQAHSHLDPRPYALPKITQTQAHPLQTDACRKINKTNNHESFPHEFFQPLLPKDTHYYPPVDQQLPYYPTPSAIFKLDKKNKHINKVINPCYKNPCLDNYNYENNYYFDEKNVKTSREIKGNLAPVLQTITADKMESHYPLAFSQNGILKSRTDIHKDDYIRFNGEKRELNKETTAIATKTKSTKATTCTSTAAAAAENGNLNSKKNFLHNYLLPHLNPPVKNDTNTGKLKFFTQNHNQRDVNPHLPQQYLHKPVAYEPIPLRQEMNNTREFKINNEFLIKNEDTKNLTWKSTAAATADTEWTERHKNWLINNNIYENKRPANDAVVNRSNNNLKLNIDCNNYSQDKMLLNEIVMKNLKILSSDDQYKPELFANDHEYFMPQLHPHQGYCHQSKEEKNLGKLSQPSKYLAMINEHQTCPQIPQRVPIYFNEPLPINNQPTTNTNAEGIYHRNTDKGFPAKYRVPQEVRHPDKQVRFDVPIAVFAAKDKSNEFLSSRKYPEARNAVHVDGKNKTMGKINDHCNYLGHNYGRFVNDPTKSVINNNQMHLSDGNLLLDNNSSNRVRKIVLPDGQIGLFVPEHYVDNHSNRSNVNNSNKNDNMYLK
ncbi:uncharacterized protein LOC130677580 isoform X2 [Microplitis mediator]|uniref:uncharacterized protein LOC130677580 isoform X2 n=1 Tax=Microplitis mediator TaxID=375433 RepID=UPI00255538EF|nr:uncharacterized protein LOC130677580 isoform X2 [Microplitis mediator]